MSGNDNVRAMEDPDLPPGWMKLFDAASGRTYYWDKGGSGQTTYVRPGGSSSTQARRGDRGEGGKGRARGSGWGCAAGLGPGMLPSTRLGLP